MNAKFDELERWIAAQLVALRMSVSQRLRRMREQRERAR